MQNNFPHWKIENSNSNKQAKKTKRNFLPLNLPSLIIVFSLILVITAVGILSAIPKGQYDNQLKISVLAEPLLEYSHIGNFSDGLAIVGIYGNSSEQYTWVKSWKYGFININGELVIPCEYDHVFRFNEGLAAVSKEGKYGFIDKNGNEVIPLEYEYAICFANGLAAVRKDGKFGFINTSGETVIPFKYSKAINFFYELTIVKKDGKYGIIDIKGNIIAPVEYDYIYTDYDYGFFHAHKDEKRGLIDISGNLIVPCIYDRIDLTSIAEGLIIVEQSGRSGILKIENYTPASKTVPIEDERLMEWIWDWE